MAIGIYKITNQINNKSYIGQSKDITRRFRQHHTQPFNINALTYDTIFYRAIRKYGLENFSFEILEQCLEEQLNDREKYWIKYYHTCIKDQLANGYNMTYGGENTFQERIYDYNEILELWNQGKTCKEIVAIVKCSKATLTAALNILQIPMDQRARRRKAQQFIPVNQYTLEGKFIASYSSVAEAVRVLRKQGIQIWSGNICYVCSGKMHSTANFIWRYKTEENSHDLSSNEIILHKQFRYSKKINQYTLEGAYVATYNNVYEAIDQNHFTISAAAIIKACDGKSKTSAGFRWKYCDEIIK